MVDVFEEVEGQIRSDRYRALALKALPVFIGLVVLVLAGVGGWQGYKAWTQSQSSKASETYAKGLEALQAGRPADAKAAWETVSKSASPVYKSLAHGQFDGLVDTGALAGLEVLATQHDGGDEAENDEGLKDVSDHDVTPGCGGP